MKENFKNWVKKHDPKLKWNWNNPQALKEQLCTVIGESGNLELRDIFELMYLLNDTGLTNKQTEIFLKEKY
jgi:hypothetical protein